jgi:hypothetical protein
MIKADSPLMLSCFDKSGIMAKPWAEAGYLCYCVDLQHPKGQTKEGNIIKVGADMHTWIPPRGKIMFAAFFPPCTHLAVSGAKWFKEKGLHLLCDAIALFARCIDITDTLDCPWMIENPVSTISSYWRKPDYMFHPWHYGDPYTKKTCLWAGNGFVMPEAIPVFPTEGSKMHRLPPSRDRSDQRSLTPAGFAQAVFNAHHKQEVCSYVPLQFPTEKVCHG